MRMPARNLLALVGLGLAATQFSGCALSELKNINRRLKEANDRLVAENNRLEQELALRERELAQRQRDIAKLKDLVAAPPPEPVQVVTAPAPRNDSSVFQSMGLDSGTSREGTWIRLDSAVVFPLGRASLTSGGQRILDRVINQLKTTYRDRTIRVEGHTDDIPIRKQKDRYPSNWELSTARACSVVRYLQNKGLDPVRIYPAGFSYYRPRQPGKSAAARQQNRRVEILILNRGEA